MRFRQHLFSLVLAIVAIGCGLGDPKPLRPERLAARDFFPLAPGTLWVYEIRDAHGGIALQRSIVRGSLFLESKNATAAVVEESGGIGGEFDLDVAWHPVAYYRRGGFLYKFSGLSYSGDELKEHRLGRGDEKVLPTDPVASPEWQSDFQIFSVDANGYGIRATSRATWTEDVVRVRAGAFRDCLRVETRTVSANAAASAASALGFRYVDWYAAGVGLVRSQVTSLDDGRRIATIELVSFREGALGR